MADLQVSKKTIGKLFSEMQNKKFIIPDFQRPYKWDIEKCETLWLDIEHFAQNEARTGSDYFLGTIVSYKDKDDDNKEIIIDGQQRITSLMLMLRAFYRKLEDMSDTDEDVIGLKNQLAPCIWDINPISQKVSDKSLIHIISQVATGEDNDTFHEILETGNYNVSKKDNYTINYSFFKQKCDKYAEMNPMQWKQLCVTIIQKCIIMPIECQNQEMALTIFNTLNDRGMPLADSDIFKAKIYSSKSEGERKKFTHDWKEFTHICKQANVSLDDIFRYYTHVLRAKSEDKSKEIGLRNFYSKDDYKILKNNGLINEIISLANFWLYLNKDIEPIRENDSEEKSTVSVESKKYLQCLSCYPNEYWKYVVSVFYIKNKNNETFDEDFVVLLKHLTAFLFTKFIESPTVNAIKDEIYAVCISVNKNNELQLKYDFKEDYVFQRIDEFSSSRLSRALLLLDAYLNPNQIDLIPETFDIEHIFPKKWQNTNYNDWDIEDAQKYLDRFGNKVVFEKRLNIQAGNGYFGIKKQKYALSAIANVKDLSNYTKNDWIKEDIEEREKEFKNRLLSFFREQLYR
ncbi:MAG: DUF262 domain-containing HNH endonuclease family protein [Prevotellaceae bacterium]|jgi:uncharacterized protein with ParB-like and HNH nuclease domain|nr:DUF262 domain-containing HNH endonuclease family protein [Prevotellaceae bacterium]